MYDNLLTKNWIIFLNQAMKENGCPHEINDVEGILANLRYLARIDDKGTSYMPLQYKRIIEKLVCGLFNSAFEFSASIIGIDKSNCSLQGFPLVISMFRCKSCSALNLFNSSFILFFDDWPC